MKKYLVMFVIFAGAFVVLPTVAKAQLNTPYIWNNNALFNRALAYSRARRAGNRKKAVRKKAVRRKAVRRARRVSSLDIPDFKRDLNILRPKEIEVV